MYDENFLAIPYIGIVLMVGAVNFALYIPLIIHAITQTTPYIN
jgi:hypothetical protein